MPWEVLWKPGVSYRQSDPEALSTRSRFRVNREECFPHRLWRRPTLVTLRYLIAGCCEDCYRSTTFVLSGWPYYCQQSRTQGTWNNWPLWVVRYFCNIFAQGFHPHWWSCTHFAWQKTDHTVWCWHVVRITQGISFGDQISAQSRKVRCMFY